MPLINLSGVSFDYGRLPILREVGFSLEPGERAAVVGRNGAGKTTLFRILQGDLRPDRGDRAHSRRLKIAWLRQDMSLDEGDELFLAVRKSQTELIAAERELEDVLETLATETEGPLHDRLLLRQGELHTILDSLEGWSLDTRLASILTGLGFSTGDFTRPLHQFSGGERRVAALASVLLSRADLLLLDEPTNHLDLSSIEWLEDYLSREKSAMLMVSHDRSFLDRLSQSTWHLRDARLHRYPGNYTKFVKLRKERERLELKAFDRQQGEIARLEDYIRRNIAGQKTKQAQSRRKQLEKIERLEKPGNEYTLKLRLVPEKRGGNTVLDAQNVSKSFGSKTLFRNLNLHIQRGEKIGLVGPNGAGKSTLLSILLGKMDPDEGQTRPGKDIDPGFFDQHLDQVDDANSVEEEFRSLNPEMGEGELRGQLARFGFFDDDLDKNVGQLSGGERNRLSLLKLVYRRHNLLVLDEPTNHLDIPATESLEEALLAYEGTLIVISHDRSFLANNADRVVEIQGGIVTDYPGNWEEFCLHKEKPKARSEEPEQPPPPPKPKAPRTRWSKNRIQKRRQELIKLEASLAEAIGDKEALESQLAETSSLKEEKIRDLAWKHGEILETIVRREARWEKWASELEERGETDG
jgi:ATP-binding cassette subfamily F protein 3